MSESPTEPLVLGKTVHAAIQMYLSGTDMHTAIECAMLQEAELPIDRNEVVKLASHSAVTSINGGQVEEHFTIPLDDDGLINFQGYIDYWRELPNGSIQLIDWKTNRMKYDPTANHQLGCMRGI